jgi:hypothetical protein
MLAQLRAKPATKKPAVNPGFIHGNLPERQQKTQAAYATALVSARAKTVMIAGWPAYALMRQILIQFDESRTSVKSREIGVIYANGTDHADNSNLSADVGETEDLCHAA